MNMTKVLLLLTVLMAAVLIVHLQSGENSDTRIGEPVFPNLKSKLNEVVNFRLRSNSQETVITTDGSVWKVQGKSGYAADFIKLSEFLRGLADARYQEKKTARAENHQQLGLMAVDQQASSAVAVTVSGDNEQLADLLLGNASAHMEGRYVRFPNQDQVWLIDKDLDISADPASWLEHVIVDVPEQDVEQVVQSSYDADPFILVREGEQYGDLQIKDMPADRKLLYPSVANELGRALVNLRLKDVSVDQEIDWSKANKTDFTCKNNLQLVVWSIEEEGRYFLKLSAQVRDTESDDSQVTALDARLRPWTYEVSKLTFQQFGKQLSDFLVEDADQTKGT